MRRLGKAGIMKGWKFKYLWLLLAAGLFLMGLTDETWFMPGPVSRSHEAIEGDCGRCHPGFSGTPNQSCLSCKDRMKLIRDSGIHRHAPIEHCATCHVEHRTRNYPLASAWVAPKAFNHDWTGFRLGKYHSKLDCRQCHLQGRPYRDAEPACDACHQNFHSGIWNHRNTGCDLDSLHVGLACRSCHRQGWGKEKTPSCQPCHPKGKYTPGSICRNGVVTGK